MNILVEGEIKTEKAFAFSIAQKLRTLFDLRAGRENSFLSSLLFASSYPFYSLHFSLSLFRYRCLSLPNSPSLSIKQFFSPGISSPVKYLSTRPFLLLFLFLTILFHLYPLHSPYLPLSLKIVSISVHDFPSSQY